MEKLERFIEKNGHSIITISFVWMVFLSVSGIMLADIPEPPEDIPWFMKSISFILGQFPEINGWFAAIMLFMMSFLRGLADIFMFIASKTETKTDDRIAQQISVVLRWIGKIIGWFGLGTPKR